MGLFSSFNPSSLLSGGDSFDLASLSMVPGAPGLPRTGGGARGLFSAYQAPAPSKSAPATAVAPAAFHPSIGRILNDVILGNSTPADSIDSQKARAAAQAQQQQYLQMIDGLNLDPREKIVALNDPAEWLKQNASRYAFHGVTGGDTVINGPEGPSVVAPAKPTAFNTAHGLYEFNPQTHQASPLVEFPQADPPAPAGFRWKADKTGLELIPGYREGVGALSGSRRDAVVSRPMPSHARPAAVPAPATGLPALPPQPWERHW